MKRVGITELRDHLSENLRDVRDGTEIEFTDRRRVIARIIPAEAVVGAVESVPPRRSLSALQRRRYSRVRMSVDSLSLLRDERGKR